jgi:uncharacterized protein (DUF4415 family)
MLMRTPLARERRRPAGFIKPCQPTLSDKAPSGPLCCTRSITTGLSPASSATRCASEAAFKKATTKPADLPAPPAAIPNAKELVSLRIDRDVLEHFQEGGPGWRDRINEALGKTAGK